MQISNQLAHSPLQPLYFNGHRLWVKRDDLLNHHFSGNKARKFSYFLENSFPDINRVVSYGSVQANSLYSLAALAQIKGWQLDYYVHNLPNWVKNTPLGNYAGAIKLGANIIEVQQLENNLDDYMQEKSQSLPSNTLFIPEGGRCKLAQHGIKKLADELREQIKQQNISNPVIMLPAGTGTTALFLQSYLPYQILTCACVGDSDYLEKQFSLLQPNKTLWPTIISTEKKYHFGKLYPEFYQIWQQLLAQTQVEFDLLYDPLGWINLVNYLNSKSEPQNIVYIHQGGLVGNESMVPRYRRKYGEA